MDANLSLFLNWAKEVLNGFSTPVLLAMVAVSLVSLFLHFKR